MSAEHRYSTRHPIDLQVYIRYRRRRFSHAQARNLSLYGMCLDVRAVTIPAGTLIELEFEYLGKEWLIPAVVVHHDASEVRVMFRDPQPELDQALRETVNRQRPPYRDLTAQGQSSLF